MKYALSGQTFLQAQFPEIANSGVIQLLLDLLSSRLNASRRFTSSSSYPNNSYRMTVRCYYSRDDALTNSSVGSVPPPVALAEKGPLAFILQAYPGET